MILRISSIIAVAVLALLFNACGTDSANPHEKAAYHRDTVLNPNSMMPQSGLEGIGDTIIVPPPHTIGPANGQNSGVSPDNGLPLGDSLKLNQQALRMLEDYTQPGNILWIIPTELKVEKDTQIIVRLIRDTATDRLIVDIDTAHTPVHIAPIATTNEMQVYLNGDPTAFRITSLGANGQNYVSNRTFTEWRWAITPLKPGTFYFSLDVVARVYIDGKAMPPISKIVYSNQFRVKTTISYQLKSVLAFCKEYWVILTAGVTGISTLVWKRQSNRRRRRRSTHGS